MNKFIPLTLASVIVIAMVFAVTPIEYAQTTHVSTPTVGTASAPSQLTFDGNSVVLNNILTGSNTMAAGAIAVDGDITVVVTVTGADTTNDVALCTIDTNADFDPLIITNAVITADTVTVTVTNPNGALGDAGVVADGTDVVRCIVFGIV